MAITKVTSSVLEDNITVAGNLNVSSGTIKLDGNHPVGTDNVALGNTALDSNSSGNYSTAVGSNALTTSTASSNTGVGFAALEANTSGTQNTAIGMQALTDNLTANNNVAVGHRAMFINMTGASNVAIGVEALAANSTASNNTAVGFQGLYLNTTGGLNTAVGSLALASALTASANTCIGASAGQGLTTGSDNTFIGYGAGQYGISVNTGASNTVVGAYSRPGAVAGTNQIILGRNIVGGGDNTFRMGSGANTATIALNGSATAFTAASDERLKENIIDSSVGLNFINDLRPITYTWKAKKDVPTDMSQYEENSTEPCRGYGKTNYGFVAQEVKAVIDNHNLVDGQNIHRVDPDGTNELAPGELVPMLVKAIQELSTQVDELKSELIALKGV